MSRLKNSWPMLASVLLAAAGSGCAHKYAVLISANKTTQDDVAIHSEWWYDLMLQYKTLKDNGFDDDKIVVLYGDGSDFATAHASYDSKKVFGHGITTMAVSKANVQKAFAALASKLTDKDYLYVWWMGHGGGGGPNGCSLSMLISNTGELVTDVEFASYVTAVPKYKKRSIAVMTCHSGGILDQFAAAGGRTVALASSTCAQNSYDANQTCDGVVHAEFNYVMPNGLRRKDWCNAPVASDKNADGLVTWIEAHQYDQASMTNSTPQLGDPDGLAAPTAIKSADP
jgi:glycosylphosphatidylinositol transamidase (GPIT) subunit GPI8